MSEQQGESSGERAARARQLVELLEEVEEGLAGGELPDDMRAEVREALALARAQRDAIEAEVEPEEASSGLEVPLPRALRDLCVDVRPASECEIDLRVSGRTRLGALSDRAATVLYEATRDLLEAFIDHGEASQVTVALRASDGEVELSVSDEATGFNPASVGPGQLNLRDLQRKLESVGGEVGWEASWEAGTKIVMSLSVDAQDGARS